MDYSRFLSAEAQRFPAASLSGLIHRFSGAQDTISLAGGLPPPEAFPLETITASTTGGLQLHLGAEGQQAYLAQQYNFNPQGYDPLREWLRDLTLHVHPGVHLAGSSKPQQQQPQAHAPASSTPSHAVARDLVVTSGAIHAICAAIACLTDPGDTLVVDEYTYTHALDCVFLPRDLRLLPVRGDERGMDPEHLAQQLQAASAAAGAAGDEPGAVRRPKLLYTIPTGHNPTGAVMTTERKRRILELCSQYDMLVLEDDAYYWLYYPSKGAAAEDAGADTLAQAAPPSPSSAGGGLSGLPPSMLSMDTEGRVLRIDTFSKVLGPGYRLGWLTAPAPLVGKLANWVMGSTVGPCSLSQVLVTRLLQAWGIHGFHSNLARLQGLYAERAAAANAAAATHLAGLATWHPVEAGMFMWIRLDGVGDVSAILDELVAARVVVVPGSMFATTGHAVPLGATPGPEATGPCASARGVTCQGGDRTGARANGPASGHVASPFFRLSFAGSTPHTLDEGMRRLAAAVRVAQEKAMKQ